MKYLVMGAGALGSVFGGLLAEHGHDVTFVGADDHLLAMQKQGLTITGIWGEHRIGPVKAYYGTKDLSGAYDVVLLSVKSYHTAAVITQTLPFIHEKSLIFSIQNGLGNWEAIAQAVGWERTVGARVIFGAEIETSGHCKGDGLCRQGAFRLAFRDSPCGHNRKGLRSLQRCRHPHRTLRYDHVLPVGQGALQLLAERPGRHLERALRPFTGNPRGHGDNAPDHCRDLSGCRLQRGEAPL